MLLTESILKTETKIAGSERCGEPVESILGNISVQHTSVFPVTSSTDTHILEVITDHVRMSSTVFISQERELLIVNFKKIKIYMVIKTKLENK